MLTNCKHCSKVVEVSLLASHALEECGAAPKSAVCFGGSALALVITLFPRKLPPCLVALLNCSSLDGGWPCALRHRLAQDAARLSRIWKHTSSAATAISWSRARNDVNCAMQASLREPRAGRIVSPKRVVVALQPCRAASPLTHATCLPFPCRRLDLLSGGCPAGRRATVSSSPSKHANLSSTMTLGPGGTASHMGFKEAGSRVVLGARAGRASGIPRPRASTRAHAR